MILTRDLGYADVSDITDLLVEVIKLLGAYSRAVLASVN